MRLYFYQADTASVAGACAQVYTTVNKQTNKHTNK